MANYINHKKTSLGHYPEVFGSTAVVFAYPIMVDICSILS